MSEQREIKRVRQACTNCRYGNTPRLSPDRYLLMYPNRRKKTRCSGERPVCSFCARLGQDCHYNDSYAPLSGDTLSTVDLQQQNAGLANRIALLESRLSLLDANGANNTTFSGLFGGSPPGASPTSSLQRKISSDLTALLDADTVKSLVDVYFRYCHAQPYSFFHEAAFREDLENGRVPYYLWLTFVATAVRFSDDVCFAGRQTECIDTYAKLAWSELIQEAFSDTHTMHVRIVQAASMLGVIDHISMLNPLLFHTGR